MRGIGALLTRQGRRPGEHERTAGAGYELDLRQTYGSRDWVRGRYRGRLAVPGAWRASLLISDLLGSVPWEAYREWGGRPIECLSPTPMLLRQPAGRELRVTTFSAWALDLVWHGNAIGVIAARNANGQATAVYPVPAEWVSVRRVDDTLWPIPVGPIEYAVGGLTFFEHEVIHIKGPGEPGALRGMGVLEMHLDTLDLSLEQMAQAQSIARHGVPTGILKTTKPDATEAELQAMKRGWLRTQRERTIAALNATTEFQPLSWNPEEMEMVEARKFSLHDLALVFGLPLSFLGADQSSRTYSNIEQESINLLKFSLNGHLARFEQTLSAQFAPGTWVKANVDAILRADTLTRYQAHAIGITNGFLTDDEVRGIEDRPPLTPAQRAELAARRTPAPAEQPERPAQQQNDDDQASGDDEQEGSDNG